MQLPKEMLRAYSPDIPLEVKNMMAGRLAPQIVDYAEVLVNDDPLNLPGYIKVKAKIYVVGPEDGHKVCGGGRQW